MKTEFPILNISPTQWVLVDKTRKPRKGENCISLEDDELYMEIFIYDGRFDDMTEEEIDEEGLLNQTFPILAAYPKIEGVLLLPSTLWEKKENKLLWAIEELDSCLIEAPTDFIGPTWRAAQREEKEWRQRWKKALEVAREAAGGYTRENILRFMDWLKHLDNGTTHYGIDGRESESIGFSPFDCFTDNLKSNEYLFDYWTNNVHSSSPRALEIEVGEDGSIPSENGVIIYKKAIY